MSHGYNSRNGARHQPNCIAEVLSDPDDEINVRRIYNTSNDLLPFIEPSYDTLTPNRIRLRVLRVRPTSRAPGGAHPHLRHWRPHSRNIAIRRRIRAERWVLFTNTDMIFLPGRRDFRLD